MFRILWRFPLYGSATPSVVTITTAESWAWPVNAYPVQSTNTIVRDPLDVVESGHKEVIN